MKKLLKFGIVSLSLTTLGVVGQLTELPVFGTQVVRAKDSVAETIRVIKYYQDSETGKHVIPATVVEVPKSETYSVTADSIDGHTPVRYSVLAFGFQWSAEGDGAIANFNHAEAIPDGDDSVIVSFYYTKNQTPPVETPESEGGGEVETPPADNPVDGGKEIYTNTTNEPIGVAVYYVGENLDGTRVKLLDSDLIITVNPGEEVSALRDFDGYTLDSTSYIPPFFSEGILTYSYKQDTPPADNPGDSDGGETQTPPTDKPVDGDKTETPAPETPEERQARINHNLRVLRSEVERVERALTYPKLTPTEAAALQAFKAKRLETIAHLEQTGELGDNNLTEADVKAFDTVLALELAGVFNDKDAEQPISTPAPKDLSADRNKLLLSLDESGLTAEQKSKLAEKIAFAETEKDLADLKAELVKLVKAAEKPANKPAKEAPKTESKAAAKPAANAPAKSDKAALPATGDVTRVGLIAAGFSLLLLGLGLVKSRKHN